MSAESQIQEARAPLSAASLTPQPACSLPEGETTQSGGVPAASDGPPPSVWRACEHSGSTPASAHVLRPAPLQSRPLWSGPPRPAGLLLAQLELGSRRDSIPCSQGICLESSGAPLGVRAGRGKCSLSPLSCVGGGVHGTSNVGAQMAYRRQDPVLARRDPQS